MADNTTLNLGSGGDTFKSEDIGAFKLAVSKIYLGAAGVNGGPVTTSNPLPVAVQGTIPVSGTFWQATQPVSGTVAVTGTFWQTTQPVSAASLPLPSGASTETTLAAISGKLGSLGQKAMAGSAPVVLASDQSSIPVSGTFWQATQPVSGTVTANAGTGTMAVSLASVPSHAVTNAGTFAVQISSALPAGTATVGNVGLVPATAGGLTQYTLIGAASTNAASVKAAAGQLYAYECFNSGASWRYLKIYNKASAPTVGTDSPVKTIGIPPGGGANFAFPQGVAFSLGIAVAVTGGIALLDATAISASEVAVNLDYA